MSTENNLSSKSARDAHMFGRQQLLHNIPRDPEAERLALTYLNRKAPDLVAMVLGGCL